MTNAGAGGAVAAAAAVRPLCAECGGSLTSPRLEQLTVHEAVMFACLHALRLYQRALLCTPCVCDPLVYRYVHAAVRQCLQGRRHLYTTPQASSLQNRSRNQGVTQRVVVRVVVW